MQSLQQQKIENILKAIIFIIKSLHSFDYIYATK